MPIKAKQLPGHVYMTAAVPQQAYEDLKASAKRLHIPMTQALGLLVVATGPHLATIVEAQQDAVAAAGRQLVESDPLVAHRTQRKRERRSPAGQ